MSDKKHDKVKVPFLKDLIGGDSEVIGEMSSKIMEDAQVIVGNRTEEKPFVDPETGRNYKTKAGMKSAITRRRKKDQSKDEV